MSQRILILLVLSFSIASSTFNYCSLCENHVACRNTGRFSRSCGNPRSVKLTQENIRTVLHAHNYYRNKIAGGNEPKFSAATKMPVLRWDPELAYFAELNCINGILKNAVKNWYDEVKHVNPSTMTGGGHFTQLVRDQAVAIGCAVALSDHGTMVTCNYSFGNVAGLGPVYKIGTSGSACIKGRDFYYRNLCKN